MWVTYEISKKLPKVNNPLLGKTSPNLITLFHWFPEDAKKWISHSRIVAGLARLIADPVLFRMLLLLTLTRCSFYQTPFRQKS
jgi:hypothetical protein